MECPICYETIQMNNANGTAPTKCAVMLSCGHGYCMECLLKSMTQNNNTCPMCRTELYDSNEIRLCNYDDEDSEYETDYDSEDDEDEDEDENEGENEDNQDNQAQCCTESGENTTIERVEAVRLNREFDETQQFTQSQIENSNLFEPFDYEYIQEMMIQNGITMMDLIVYGFNGKSNLDKYNTRRKCNNVNKTIDNIIIDMDNAACERYAMGLEDICA